jgi:hypothetical protein
VLMLSYFNVHIRWIVLCPSKFSLLWMKQFHCMEKHNLCYGFKCFANVCEIMYNINSLFQEILQPKEKIERCFNGVHTYQIYCFLFCICHQLQCLFASDTEPLKQNYPLLYRVTKYFAFFSLNIHHIKKLAYVE